MKRAVIQPRHAITLSVAVAVLLVIWAAVTGFAFINGVAAKQPAQTGATVTSLTPNDMAPIVSSGGLTSAMTHLDTLETELSGNGCIPNLLADLDTIAK